MKEKDNERGENTDSDIAVRALKHLVHSLRTKRSAENTSYCFGRGNVGFLSIKAS